MEVNIILDLASNYKFPTMANFVLPLRKVQVNERKQFHQGRTEYTVAKSG